jgi:hypothetical protein
MMDGKNIIYGGNRDGTNWRSRCAPPGNHKTCKSLTERYLEILRELVLAGEQQA